MTAIRILLFVALLGAVSMVAIGGIMVVKYKGARSPSGQAESRRFGTRLMLGGLGVATIVYLLTAL